MAKNIIKVGNKEKSTSIRLSERTKKMLDALAVGKETHEEILLRLIKMANIASTEEGSQIIERKNAIGTRYKRDNKTINIDTNKSKYSIVCTFNDLNVIHMLRDNKQLANYISKELNPEWEVDLEIVNIKKDKGSWQQPSSLRNKHEFLLLYLVSLKYILEETFAIKIFEITTDEDYFDLEKWEKAYKRNKLSMESFYSDVEKKLKGNY